MRVLFLVGSWLIALCSYAQISVPNTTAVTENFDGMGAPASATAATALPANWKMSLNGTVLGNGFYADWSDASNITAVTQDAPSGATCTGNLVPSTGGAYCWGESGGATCTDRAIGFMTSAGYKSDNCIMAQYVNANSVCLTSLTISYDVRKFRSNTATFELDFYFSLDGKSWTSFDAYTIATEAASYFFPATAMSTRNITINSLNIPKGANFYLKWNFLTPGSANSKGIGIDNVSVTAAFAAADAAPTTASSGLTFSDIGCNSFTANWTNGNGTYHLVVVNTGAITGTPVAGTYYPPSAVYSSAGSPAFPTAGQVVYYGTGNSVSVTGCASSTTYTVKVFEGNCTETYLTATTVTSSLTTDVCATCSQMTGAMIDACGSAPCSEGNSEVLFFNSGSYGINVASQPPVVSYSTTLNPATVYASNYNTNAATTATMNTMTGCTNSFIDASDGYIPPGATYVTVNYNFCPTNYDFSNLCASFSPIYVLYATDANWGSGGNFDNHQPSSTPRYFTTDLSASSAGCTYYYTYDANTLASGDGSAIAFGGAISTNSATPTSPSSYPSSGCLLPIVLPVNLLNFNAVAIDETNSKLNFVTSNEENVKQYIISKSLNGYNYSIIDKEISLNRQTKTNYVSYDKINSESGSVIYYRLEEEDFNGVKKIVANCFLNLKPSKEIIVSYNESGILISMPVSAKSIELLSLDGKSISFTEENDSDLLFKMNLESLAKGFYLLRITDENEKVTVKKIIH